MAVVLLGPRQVGKTTPARTLAKDWPGVPCTLDLERPAHRLCLQDASTPTWRAEQGKLVVLDASTTVRAVFLTSCAASSTTTGQAGICSGQSLSLGSAALDLMRQSSETLAGCGRGGIPAPYLCK